MLKQVVTPKQMTIRHIKRGVSTDPGAVAVLASYYVPQDPRGVNGEGGFTQGERVGRRDEEGEFTISLPNAGGSDGVLHRERFLIVTDPAYEPGDEFIEIWEGPVGRGECVFVGTPTSAKVGTTVELAGYDALWLLKRTRETMAGFHVSAPRAAMEDYSGVWRTLVSEDFGADGPVFAFNDDGVTRTSSDGEWDYRRAEALGPALGGGVATIKVSSNLAENGIVETAGAVIDLDEERWRIEASLTWRDVPAVTSSHINFYAGTAASDQYLLVIYPGLQYTVETPGGWGTGGAGSGFGGKNTKGTSDSAHVAIERNGDWAYFYVDGKLVAVHPTESGIFGSSVIGVEASTQSMNASEVDIDFIVARVREPFLNKGADRGDHYLPGSPTPGGLIGSYYLETDLPATGAQVTKLLDPTKEPYARRLDPMVNFAASATWMPPGPPSAERFSARWVGAIYLDLEFSDRWLRVTSDDRHRVYIAGMQYLNDWNTGGHVMTAQVGGSLRTFLEQTAVEDRKSAWYPIVIEYHNGSLTGGIQLEWSGTSSGGPWGTVGSWALSPMGIFETQMRGESHYEALMNLRDTFAHQFVCQPKSLESGEFPGAVVPRVRVGRDTEAVVTEDNLLSPPEVSISAEERADALLADASGLADTLGATQVSAEVFNWAEMANHLFLHQEAESESDITFQELLLQRLASKLTLRSSPWQEVSAQPRGDRELLDRFPLTGDLANYDEFAWEPGDGVRLDLPTRSVRDVSPRPIMTVSWPFFPDGYGVPSIGFRARPRDARAAVQRIQRTMFKQIRNFQGQQALVQGTVGQNPTPAAVGGVTDAYSRCVVPVDMTKVIRAWFVVTYKGDSSSQNIEINGTNRLTFTKPGRYDITAWVQRNLPDTENRIYARATGGTNVTEYMIEILVAV